MLARIFIWLFYALVFFFIGVWSSPHVPGFRALLQKGADASVSAFERIQGLAQGSISASQGSGKAFPTASQLDIARMAFARGDISVAISAYQDIVKQNPDDLDARGELGNVLFSAGRLPEAAQIFHETALKLIDKGEATKARALVPAIRRGSATLATDIERRLGQSKAPEAEAKPRAG